MKFEISQAHVSKLCRQILIYYHMVATIVIRENGNKLTYSCYIFMTLFWMHITKRKTALNFDEPNGTHLRSRTHRLWVQQLTWPALTHLQNLPDSKY